MWREKKSYGLAAPSLTGVVALEQALHLRRSIRAFAPRSLPLEAVAQLLWAAQGISSPDGRRTAPSAGALYPLELYLVAGSVEGLASGCYRYLAHTHTLSPKLPGDLRPALAEAAMGQGWIAQAPAAVVIAADYSRTEWKYAERAERYVHIEAGHAGQNLVLQAVALDLGTTVVGAFDDLAIKGLLQLGSEEQPLVIIPIGYPRSGGQP